MLRYLKIYLLSHYYLIFFFFKFIELIVQIRQRSFGVVDKVYRSNHTKYTYLLKHYYYQFKLYLMKST